MLVECLFCYAECLEEERKTDIIAHCTRDKATAGPGSDTCSVAVDVNYCWSCLHDMYPVVPEMLVAYHALHRTCQNQGSLAIALILGCYDLKRNINRHTIDTVCICSVHLMHDKTINITIRRT